jgi:hypothetical protein
MAANVLLTHKSTSVCALFSATIDNVFANDRTPHAASRV